LEKVILTAPKLKPKPKPKAPKEEKRGRNKDRQRSHQKPTRKLRNFLKRDVKTKNSKRIKTETN